MSLRDMCQQLVKFKFSLDEKIETQKMFSDINNKSNVHAIPPFRFAEKVIPFWTLKNAETPKTSFVDPNMVIGATYKSFEEATIDKCDKINDDNSNVAEYEKIGDLPLYIAIEGKNRVRLFQKHRIKIKARVIQISFPLPSELQLHQCRKTINYFLSCSNNFYVQQKNWQVLLLYPNITVPFFKSYGVAEGKPINNTFFINAKKLQMQRELEAFSLQ